MKLLLLLACFLTIALAVCPPEGFCEARNSELECSAPCAWNGKCKPQVGCSFACAARKQAYDLAVSQAPGCVSYYGDCWAQKKDLWDALGMVNFCEEADLGKAFLYSRLESVLGWTLVGVYLLL